MATNKVVYNGATLIDLSTDTLTDASQLASGIKAHTRSGVVITGTNSGGGGSAKNVQCYQGYATVAATSYTDTAVKLTVAKTGTYTVSWSGWRSTNSGTNGSQLYIGNSAYGSAQTTFVNTYGQSVVLNNVSLTAGQVITVRARSRSTSYQMGVANLCIVEN